MAINARAQVNSRETRLGWWRRTAFCFHNECTLCLHPHRPLSVDSGDRCKFSESSQVGAAERAKILIWYFVSNGEAFNDYIGKNVKERGHHSFHSAQDMT
jgi:hypothetical protein